MLYFIPATDENVSPIPYSAPCMASSGATWIGPDSYRRDGHYEQWARITLHGIIIWEVHGISKSEAEQRMRSKMANIAQLARNDACGTVNLMATDY